MYVTEPSLAARPVRMLLVEDNPADVRWVLEVFREAKLQNSLSVVTDGEEALQFLRREGRYESAEEPDLILLDLNLPRRNGLEVIAEISADPHLRGIPLVILTSSPQERPQVVSEFHLPASRYLLKPLDWQKYLDSVRDFDDLFLSVVARSRDTDPAEAVRESEERFRLMADSATVMIWLAGRNAHREFFNEPWFRFTGRTAKQEGGSGWLETLHPDDRQQCLDTYLKAFRERQAFRMEYRVRTHDGQYRWVLGTGVPRYQPSGRFAGYVGSCVDIHERRETEEALRRSLEDLKRSNEELEQFAYLCSHDLQEPLRMISSYVQLLARRYRGNIDEEADRYIGFAVEGVARMQRLIAELLEFSRAGISRRTLESIDAGHILNEALDNLRACIKEAAAEIDCGPMPPVQADPTQLRQVFQNLIGNAIKFRRKDAALRVTIRSERRGEHFLFSISDTGIGIDSRHGDRLFKMFQRLHSRGRYEGAGIGLAMSRKIIEHHGGAIWYESEVGQGSTFYFTLPAPPYLPK